MSNRKKATLFHIIDDARVILRSKGVYRQTDLYRRGVELFAKQGGGYVRLMGNGATSHPSTSWVDMDAPVGVRTEGGKYNAPQWCEE